MSSEKKTIALHWLRQPLVLLNDIPVKLETRKAVALIAYLSMNDRSFTRDTLASIFWADFDENRAPANLRRTLCALHASLGDELIDADRDSIKMGGAADVWVDAKEFTRLMGEARSRKSEANAGDSTLDDYVAQAIELYKGDFLEGFNLKDSPVFDDWQGFQRERMRRDIAWALEHSYWAELEKKRWDEATAVAQRWVEVDTLDERARRAYMTILALSGQRNAALRQFEECDRMLRQELGVGASSETGELAQKIREGQTPSLATKAVRFAQPGSAAMEKPNWKALPLLRTKLFIPRRRDRLVGRSRLMALFDQSVERPLTIVSAPAGFGKSTLASEWVSTSPYAVAWLSLDADDSDPAHFLLYLSAALGTIDPGLQTEALEMLHSFPAIPYQSIVSALLNKLETLDRPFVLFLDDFQFVASAEVAEILSYFIERMPDTLRMVILSRSDPSLPLARMRSRGLLSEIRSDDLRFSLDEARSFLREAMGLSLSDDEIAHLEARTEGWIVGLQMAALSMREGKATSLLLERFSGHDRYLLEYFMEEVLERQSPEVRDFLLSISIPERFCASLCESLADSGDGHGFIRQLEKAGLFLISLDREGTWFRFHHLFGEFLRKRLSQERSCEEVLELHQKAGAWLLKNGLAEEAIKHFLAARDFHGACKVIVESSCDIVAQGLCATTLRWIEAIPLEIVANWPELSLLKAEMLLFAARTAEAAASIEDMRTGIAAIADEDRRLKLETQLCVMQGYLCFFGKEFDCALTLMDRAKAKAEYTDDHVFRASYLIRFLIHKSRFEWAKAEEAFRESAAIAKGTKDVWSYALVGSEQAFCLKTRGRLRDSASILDDILCLAESQGAGKYLSLAQVYLGLADVERETGNLELAKQYCLEAKRRVDRWGSLPHMVLINTVFSLVAIELGDFPLADDLLSRAEGIIESGESIPGHTCLVAAFRARLIYAAGDIGAAGRWLEALNPELSPEFDFRELLLIASARLRLLESRESPAMLDEALRVLDALARTVEENGGRGRLIEVLVLLALSHRRKADEEAAFAALGKALILAEPEGFYRVFRDEGEELAELLRSGIKKRRWKSVRILEYAQWLIA